jgi:cyclophilin family peptidyl-prolyl cis-trans isomerase
MARSSFGKGPCRGLLSGGGVRRRRTPISLRRTRIEALEPRWTLSTAPTLEPIADATLLAGAPLYIALDGYDADGDALTFSVTSTDSHLTSTLSETNRSMKISVLSDDGTIHGDMIFELFENLAPDVTGRIIELANSGFYDSGDGLIFHRVAKNNDGTPFVIQGGDPNGDGTGGSGENFDDEFNPLLMHTSAGVLSMAKGTNDDTNDSQFFITGAATRHLDFNHSVFGYLVEGDSIRQAIQNVATDSNSKPLVDVHMKAVDVILDKENGALILTAPEGYTGQADVTVTASDGNGGTASRTFHVTIQADTTNNNPYLQTVSPLSVNAGASGTLTLHSVDVEGDAVYYDAAKDSDVSDITVSVNHTTGVLTVTAGATAGGVYEVLVGVANTGKSAWDTQEVPVLVTPAAPTSIDLLTSSDTGSNTADNVTSMNNTASKVLWFGVSGVVKDAMVSLYDGDQLIGQTTATSNYAVIVTDGTHSLGEGSHSITAVQGFYNEAVDVGNSDQHVTLVSGRSAALAITVDTTPPQFTSTPITSAKGGVEYVYDVGSDAETAVGTTYSFAKSPAGMLIDAQTGRITWTPRPEHGPDQQVIVAVVDAAGNRATQDFEIQINRAPLFYEAIGSRQVNEGSLLTFEVVASDPDSTPTDIVVTSFSLDAGAPAGAEVHATSPTTAVFMWTPTESQGAGAYDVWIRLTDEDGATNATKISVTVSEVNQPPVLSAIPGAAADEGELLVVNVSATDPDLPANTLTYRLAEGSAAGAAIDAATGRFTWQPGEQFGGSQVAFTVIVKDEAGATDQKTFQVAVAEVDNAPVFEWVDSLSAIPGMTFRTRAEAVDPDTTSAAVRYSLEPGAPEDATIDAATGVIVWEVPNDQALGPVYLAVRATEILDGGGTGLSTVATLQVQVMLFPDVAFDRALVLSPVLETPAAREAVDSLLFDSVRTIRFVPAPQFALPEEPILGFRIGTDGGGSTPIGMAAKDAQLQPDGPSSQRKAERPASYEDRPKSESESDDEDDNESSSGLDPTDGTNEAAAMAPPELLDAAMEQLSEEMAQIDASVDSQVP